jgi:hypothetical protein
MVTVLPSLICRSVWRWNMLQNACHKAWSGSGCSVALSLKHNSRAGPTLYLTHADSLVTSTQDSVETTMPFLIFAIIYGSTKIIQKFNFSAKIARFFFPFLRKLSDDPIFSTTKISRISAKISSNQNISRKWSLCCTCC